MREQAIGGKVELFSSRSGPLDHHVHARAANE